VTHDPTLRLRGAAIMATGGARTIDLAPTEAAPVAPPDDRSVVEAVLRGDRDAFRTLVERESASVVRACQRILGDRHAAEDAAQEAFVTAYRALATWRGEGAFGAWVARIAVRIALRQAAKLRTVAWIDPTGAHGPEPHGLPGDAPDPALVALRSERTADIRAAVAKLDEPYRETIALRFFAERSLAEIADETGRPVATVKTHLHRGLQRLRVAMGDRGVER
jgi:RNA polymerase sigma-70 factor (ECF subfamily)